MALNEVEVAQIRRAGEHFKKVLRETFELFPRSARTIAGFARWTEINKSTSQRLVQALTKSTDGIDVIVTLPGINGLKQVNTAVKKLVDASDSLHNFNQMVDEYEDLILQYASSQSELKRALQKFQSKASVSADFYNRKLKKSAYETNKEITGESVDILAGVHFFRVSPDDDNYIDEFILSNKIGVELSKFARPFVQSFGGNLDEITIQDPIPLDESQTGSFQANKRGEYLLKQFSSPGIEESYAGVGNLKNSLVYNHTVDPINCGKFNISIAHMDPKTQRSPIKDDFKIVCQSIMQRSPAKRLILVALLDKKLDHGCLIQSGCYPASVKIHEIGHQPEDLWGERFSDAPEIKIFSPEDASLAAKLKIEHLDGLLQTGFELLQEKAEDFVGYFIDVEYPLWLTSHRFYFKFDE